jgi:hypothetical protein
MRWAARAAHTRQRHLVPGGGADARRAWVAGEELPRQAQHGDRRKARRLQADALPHRRGHCCQ